MLLKKKLAEMAEVVPMTEIAGYASKILEGQVKGRMVRGEAGATPI